MQPLPHPPPRIIATPKSRKSKHNRAMPGLTVDTSPGSQSHHSPANSSFPSTSRSASPVRPPVSPITPTLGNAQLATSPSQNAAAAPPRQTYTHAQPPQTAIPLPAPVPITLDENPDAIALRSAITILQMQARKAENDMRTLSRMKEKALQNPEGFATAVAKGEVATVGDGLLNPTADEEDDDDDDEDESGERNINRGNSQPAVAKKEKWEKLPKPQQVVRAPPINWEKYAVVGESLDKLHEDQRKRPSEGKPQVIGPDGKLRYGGEAARKQYEGVAVPYTPGKDKIKKNGKR